MGTEPCGLFSRQTSKPGARKGNFGPARGLVYLLLKGAGPFLIAKNLFFLYVLSIFLLLFLMDSELLQTLKKNLLEERARLELELSRFAHRNPKATEAEFSAEFPNIGDKDETESASEVAQYSDNLSLEDELEKAVRDVDAALKLIETGTYGVCKYCHQPIDERRLLARPTSTSCIQCKKTLTQEM